MLRILVEGVILYLLYRFVVHFIIPAYRTFKRARKQVKEMQRRMNEQAQNQQRHTPPNAPKSHANAHSARTKPQNEEGEYIDYEEVK